MMHLDTHVLVWLFGGQRDRIPVSAAQRIEFEQLAISPVVELELAYLFEMGKVTAPPQDVLSELAPALELVISAVPFPSVVREAIGLRWTRDPFDRIIAAQAVAEGASLLTADTTILENLPLAVWGAE